ncbi:hypothetical protein SDC9_66013 [bioreactor metagenome]|uniref:Uncharacterized protein n=1 Tax=bioreactor metagenome TaxID=1076179 RepID=A0A644XUK3_9ZZZZ
MRNASLLGQPHAKSCGFFLLSAQKTLLNPGNKGDMMFPQDRGADETALRKPTGNERSGSDFAELKRQVCRFGGAGENISGTVRGKPRGRYLLTGNSAHRTFVWERLSVESVFSTDFLLHATNKRMEETL